MYVDRRINVFVKLFSFVITNSTIIHFIIIFIIIIIITSSSNSSGIVVVICLQCIHFGSTLLLAWTKCWQKTTGEPYGLVCIYTCHVCEFIKKSICVSATVRISLLLPVIGMGRAVQLHALCTQFLRFHFC